MVNTDGKLGEVLEMLGARLKDARLSRNESQEVFAARIGLTRQSYAKMEKGAGVVPIANWLVASDILGRLDTWQDVLTGQEDLFVQYKKKQQKRKRASRSEGKRSYVGSS
nr:helix-turn-helix transcriptional regulator [Desulfobulbaceae bacterium]